MVVKFDNNGNRIWATYYGGGDEDYSEAITCDSQNNVIIGGMTLSNGGIATTGTYLPAPGGGVRDGFVAKFSENGNRIWGTYYGGNGEEFVHGITSDPQNDIIIAGWSYSTNNIATSNSYQPVFLDNGTVWTSFVAKLNSVGNRVWGTYYGYGNMYGMSQAEDVVTDNLGNIFVCGETMAPNGIATCNAVQHRWGGNQDMFVAMFSETIIGTSVSATIVANQNGSICAGMPATFNATVINGGTSPAYQWTVNGVNAGTNNPVFTTSNLNNGDKVSCTVTSNSPCISNPTAISNVIAVTISPSVMPAINITSSAAGSICPGTPVTFVATPSNGGDNPFYQWKINGINAGAYKSTFSINTLAEGDIINCDMTNPSSCNPITSAISNDITVDVLSVATPLVTINASEISVCAGKPVTFTASALNAGPNPTYQWKVNGNLAGSNITYTTSSLSSNDSVQCFLIPGYVACAGSASIASNKIAIHVYLSPDFSIQPENPIISKGDTVQLSINGANILNYEWTPALNISDNTIGNPLVWPVSTQTYTVKAASPEGCLTSKQVTVMVISDVFIPSAFTPNGDGLNDYWGINGLELYPGCHVRVFNRWGEIVYQSSGYGKPWDGRYKDQNSSTATFVYTIDLKNGKRLTGTVTVIR
jgi:gliding motility-associated-like protein